MRPIVKAELAMIVSGLALTFLSGAMGQLAIHAGASPVPTDTFVKAAMLIFFTIFGFGCIGMMIHVFILMQAGIGNAQAPFIRALAERETIITLAAWGFLGVGAAIAIPFAIADTQSSGTAAVSRGNLVANIGMTVDEVKRASTLPLGELHPIADGSRWAMDQVPFDFRAGVNGVELPRSRFYWLQTGRDLTHLAGIKVGVGPPVMTVDEMKALTRNIEQQLAAAGWARVPPGITSYRAPDQQWKKGGTLLTLEVLRQEQRPYSETFALEVILISAGKSQP